MEISFINFRIDTPMWNIDSLIRTHNIWEVAKYGRDALHSNFYQFENDGLIQMFSYITKKMEGRAFYNLAFTSNH
jgi:hypothetical protein